ncbi:MAG TPA: class I SAM-dependent methyltransferase [Pedobacter sp.]|uniref:class I SAM-dependent methyltransferase n=1 Tax=Pedobacter sp. TaxID=1411316 RepID=UPI002C003818|nr:class I SAM-dependent methyltransferase [Pedobacter sp.]HMI04751.1 class I SAM-dependent methyltransferase [Pedobacter sp.]
MSEIKDETQLMEIAKQLSCPSGEYGILTAQNMASHNNNMISEAILGLALTDKQRVLEIGPGGGNHVPKVFKQSKDLKYYGVDISELMIIESVKANHELVDSGQATFTLANGKTLVFFDEFFDCAFTVNTIYFWDEPKAYAQEIMRVIKPGGLFSVAFAPKNFMEKLPFTKYTFQLYSLEEAQAIFVSAGFIMLNSDSHQETIMSNAGQTIDREFIILILRKPFDE